MLDKYKLYDMAIVGCGPAGLSAALNARARNKEVLVLGGQFCSVKLHKSAQINNYLGIPSIGGEELRQKFLDHVQANDISVKKAIVDKILPRAGEFSLSAKNVIYRAKTAILATGIIDTRFLPGEEELLGRGVSYCATCDGMFYKDKNVAVIAYDQEAEHEANFLADICSEVFYLPQYKGSYALNEKIKVIDQKAKGILGEKTVQELLLDDGQKLAVEGIFIVRPITPLELLVPGLDTEGSLIKVDRKMATNITGLYAAGDCTGRPWQLAKAVGEGQVAALNAVSYLDVLRANEKSHAHETVKI